MAKLTANEIEINEKLSGLENYQLAQKVKALGQYSLRNNIIRNGIQLKEEDTENSLIEAEKEVAEKLANPIEDYDINIVHRLPSNDNNPPPVDCPIE